MSICLGPVDPTTLMAITNPLSSTCYPSTNCIDASTDMKVTDEAEKYYESLVAEIYRVGTLRRHTEAISPIEKSKSKFGALV